MCWSLKMTIIGFSLFFCRNPVSLTQWGHDQFCVTVCPHCSGTLTQPRTHCHCDCCNSLRLPRSHRGSSLVLKEFVTKVLFSPFYLRILCSSSVILHLFCAELQKTTMMCGCSGKCLLMLTSRRLSRTKWFFKIREPKLTNADTLEVAFFHC